MPVGENPLGERALMATLPQHPAVPNIRRLLLIDFDWRDADWLPELFRSPG